jgi:hypothetical protein
MERRNHDCEKEPNEKEPNDKSNGHESFAVSSDRPRGLPGLPQGMGIVRKNDPGRRRPESRLAEAHQAGALLLPGMPSPRRRAFHERHGPQQGAATSREDDMSIPGDCMK